MNGIEIIIGLLLLFMAVPDVCSRLAKPALVFPAFVLFGIMLGPFANAEVETMLEQAGVIGFLLLLFQVGLEIDLPPLRKMVPALKFSIPWVVVQYPVLLVLGLSADLSLAESLLAAAAITGASVGMALPAIQSAVWTSPAERQRFLEVLVILETLAIVLLAVEAPALKTGFSSVTILRLFGVLLAIVLVARFAPHFNRLFYFILERSTHWRTHLLVLLVLAVCALGERLGLAAAKTAFFLGLFMSRAEHDGKPLEEHMAPVSQRFLIPIFFVSLGMRVEWSVVFSWIGLTAFGTAGLILGMREVLHRRWLRLGDAPYAFLLLCPNLTIAALGAASLHNNSASPKASGWLLLTGLFMTVLAIVFPQRSNKALAGSRENAEGEPAVLPVAGSDFSPEKLKPPTGRLD